MRSGQPDRDRVAELVDADRDRLPQRQPLRVRVRPRDAAGGERVAAHERHRPARRVAGVAQHAQLAQPDRRRQLLAARARSSTEQPDAPAPARPRRPGRCRSRPSRTGARPASIHARRNRRRSPARRSSRTSAAAAPATPAARRPPTRRAPRPRARRASRASSHHAPTGTASSASSTRQRHSAPSAPAASAARSSACPPARRTVPHARRAPPAMPVSARPRRLVRLRARPPSRSRASSRRCGRVEHPTPSRPSASTLSHAAARPPPRRGGAGVARAVEQIVDQRIRSRRRLLPARARRPEAGRIA